MKPLLSFSIVFFPLFFCACGGQNPTSPTPYPCTLEVCDLVDNDCDGEIDEGNDVDTSPAPALWYHDADRDGWGDSSVQCSADTAGIGWSLLAGDCNEANQNIHPDAYEYCNDGIDRNCDGRPTHCGIYGEMTLADAGAVIVGEVPGHVFGNVARLPADFDLDGFSDLALSASWSTTVYYGGDIPQSISGEGEFWLHPGPLFGTLTASDLAEHFLGPYIEDSLGSEIRAGDLTGDGLPELILGSRGAQSARQYDNQGIIYIFFGPIESGLSLADADVRLLGDNEGDRLGSSIAAPADSDDDGILDLFAASCCTHLGQEYEVGTAYRFGSPLTPGDLLASDATLQLNGEQELAAFANDCQTSLDLSGDGIADLGVNSPWDSSRACEAGSYYLFFGPKQGTLLASEADVTLYSRESGEWFGASASLAGDIDGDGIHDALIGALPSNYHCIPDGTPSDEKGHAYLFSGPLKGDLDATEADAVFEGEEAGDRAGGTLLAGADFDQDGYDDIVMSSSTVVEGNRRLSSIHIFYGPVSGWYSMANADAYLLDRTSFASVIPMDVGGDLNGDGYPELVVSAYRTYSNSEDPGTVYIFFGGPRP